MNRRSWIVAGLAIVVFAALPVRAQEKPKGSEERKPATPIKVQVVLSEWEGDKKVSSLPYIFSAEADAAPLVGRPASLRLGLRVPITVSGKEGATQFQYMDVGTDVDCNAKAFEDGRYELNLILHRSSLYSTGPERKSVEWSTGEQVAALARLEGQPIVRQFSINMHVFLKDGQTVQSMLATDPISGRVLKADVTLTVLK